MPSAILAAVNTVAAPARSARRWDSASCHSTPTSYIGDEFQNLLARGGHRGLTSAVGRRRQRRTNRRHVGSQLLLRALLGPVTKRPSAFRPVAAISGRHSSGVRQGPDRLLRCI